MSGALHQAAALVAELHHEGRHLRAGSRRSESESMLAVQGLGQGGALQLRLQLQALESQTVQRAAKTLWWPRGEDSALAWDQAVNKTIWTALDPQCT